jgi:toxin FitB
MNLVDTSGWIEYFFGGPNAAYFAGAVEGVEALVVPTVCLYEVFKKVNQIAEEAKALQAVAQMKQGRVVSLDEAVALRAALMSLKHRLPMVDCFIYATARIHGATLWTQDDHFKGLPRVNYKEARTAPSPGRRAPR